MGQNWFYAQGNQQLGPVPLQQLSAMIGQGQVALTDLVWTDGMAAWIPAGNVPELSQAAPAVAAPGVYPGAPVAAGGLQYYSQAPLQVEYAGFWLRFVAAILDAIITGIGGAILGFIIGFSMAAAGARGEAIQALSNVVGIILGWLYAALLESGSAQATIGKMALGLRVTDLAGQRITFGRATGRYFGKIISALCLLIGYIMAGFTERKQALHDIMAGCLVIRAPR